MRAMPHAIEWSLATPITSPRLPFIIPDMTFSLQTTFHDLASFLRGHHRHDLKLGQIAPANHPFLQQTCVITLPSAESIDRNSLRSSSQHTAGRRASCVHGRETGDKPPWDHDCETVRLP